MTSSCNSIQLFQTEHCQLFQALQPDCHAGQRCILPSEPHTKLALCPPQLIKDAGQSAGAVAVLQAADETSSRFRLVLDGNASKGWPSMNSDMHVNTLFLQHSICCSMHRCLENVLEIAQAQVASRLSHIRRTLPSRILQRFLATLDKRTLHAQIQSSAVSVGLGEKQVQSQVLTRRPFSV